MCSLVRSASLPDTPRRPRPQGVSGRPSGISEVRRFQASPICQPSISLHSASIFLHIGVSTAPGQMQFEVILSAASTCAAVRVRLMAHAFSCALQHEKDGTQVDRQHTVPVVLGDIEQLPNFSDPSVVEQHVKASPALVRQIEHTLDVLCMGNVRLHRSLPKLVGKALCAVTILVHANNNCAPSRAMRRAHAAPMPLAAPVMSV